MSKYVIIGNNIAGLTAVKTLLRYVDGAEITVISGEKHLPYTRVLLTHLIAGKVTRDQLNLVEKHYFSKNDIRLVKGVHVEHIDPENKLLFLENGEEICYQSVLVATGGSPFIPQRFQLSDSVLTGVRTIEDVHKISRFTKNKQKIAVLGGGPVGVKLSSAVKAAGGFPEMIVSSPHILSQVADDEAASIIRGQMSKYGVDIKTGTDIKDIEKEDDGTVTLKFVDGTESSYNLVVFCKGVQANTNIFGEMIHYGRGLRVDRFMRTQFQDVYAAGDVSETYEISSKRYLIAATWPHAVQQGRVAAMNMSGNKLAYKGSLFRNAMEVFGLPFISIGAIKPMQKDNWDIEIENNMDSYCKKVYRDGILVGVQLVGDVINAGRFQAEIRRGAVDYEYDENFSEEDNNT